MPLTFISSIIFIALGISGALLAFFLLNRKKICKLRKGVFVSVHTGIFPQEIKITNCIEALSLEFIVSLIISEDDLFFEHKGLNVPEIINALKDLIFKRTIRSGSSITQQTCKLLFLNKQRSIKRKVREYLSAFLMEYCLSKDEILSLYLQVCKFGPDLVGIDNACFHYYNKLPKDLTLSESLILCQALRRPIYTMNYASGRHIEEALNYSLAYEKAIRAIQLLRYVKQNKLNSIREVKSVFSKNIKFSELKESEQIEINSLATLIIHDSFYQLSKMALRPVQLVRLVRNYFNKEESFIIDKTILSGVAKRHLPPNLQEDLDEEKIISFGIRHKIVQLIKPDAEIAERFPLLLSTYEDQKLTLAKNVLVKTSNLRELREIISNAPFLLVKGIDLAYRLYEEPWKRPFGDLDILLCEDYSKEIIHSLARSGYEINCSEYSEDQLDKIIGHCVKFKEPIHVKNGLNDLDFHILPADEFNSIFSDSLEFSICNIQYRTLSKEKYLIFLLSHLKKHNFHNLLWLNDIAVLLSRFNDEELLQFHEKTLNTSIGRAFALAISLSFYLCGLDVKEDISSKIFNEDPCVKLYHLGRLQISRTDKGLARSLFNLKTQTVFEPYFMGKLRIVLKRIFKPTLGDIVWKVLPSRLGFLYYGVRPLRIVATRLFSKNI